MRVSKWFSHYEYNDKAEYNLFCFVHAGGSSGFYSGWSKYFDSNVNVIPVEYPMREKRFLEKMPDTIQELSESLVNENEDFFSDKKNIFWGHCTGGLVAFETAKYLYKAKNLNTEYLFISSLTAPEFSQVPDISGMSDEEFTDFIIQSGFVAKELCENKEILEYFMPIARADFYMHYNYKSEADTLLNTPVILFNGKDDHLNISEDKINAWKNYTSEYIEKNYYDGDHFYINNNLKQVCDKISEYINKLENEI